MASFWENDPVADAPAGPMRIDIGKMPSNVARGADTDSSMVRAAAAGGATGPLYLAGAPVEVPTMMAKGLAALPNLMGLDPQSKVYKAVDKVTPEVGHFTNAIRSGAAKLDTAAHHALGNNAYQSPFTYQAKDPREELAYNIASGATSNPVAPIAGALSAGASTVAGDALKDTPLEAPARLVAGLVGGATPYAASRYLPATTAQDLIGKMTAGTTPEQWEKGIANQNAGNSIGVQLSGAESMQQAHGMQGPLGTLQRVLENSPASAPAFRQVVGGRPAAVDRAGRAMLENTFGAPVSPQQAANAGSNAASGAVQQAVNTRTEAGRPFFQPASGQSKPALAGLDDLKKLTDDEITKAGALTDKGKALINFRKQLEQGAPPPTTEVQEQLKAAGLKPGTPGWEQAVAQVAPGESPQQPLGPLMSTNREFARRLSQKYVTGLPADQQAGFAQEIGATLGQLNSKLTDLLKGESPEYAAGLKVHGDLSPEVSRLSNGAVGRIRDADEGMPGERVAAQANNLLSADARPAEIRQTVADLKKGELASYEADLMKQGLQKGTPPFMEKVAQFEPTAASQLIGSHLENLFNKATAKNQTGPNLFGGAKFATAVMGNPQMAENLQATVEALHSKQAWPGVQKFMQVMEATGKRKATNSETQMNQEVQADVNRSGGLLVGAAHALNPLTALSKIGEVSDEIFARMNQKQLAEVLTHPQSVQKMREMAVWGAQSRQAKQLATQAIQLANPSENNSAQQNGRRETSPAEPAAPQGMQGWQPPETDTLYAPAAGGPVSALDRDSAIRTMYGEASGEGPEGQAAVAHVILNRAKSGKFGDSIRDVVMAKNQFEPWGDRQARARIESLRPDSPVYQQLGEIFDKAAEGEAPDNTKGATHFIAMQMQKAMGRKVPEWAHKNAQVAQIGGHTFYAP